MHPPQGALEPLDHTHYTDGMEEPASQQSHAHLGILPGSGFIGRQQEMAELRSALDDVLSGQGQLVMLVGEPGIGKTRTAQETTSYAADRNDAKAAQEHYPCLLPLRGTMVLFGMVATDRVLGLLAQTMGNWDQAVAHFDEGLSFCRNAGYRPELGWVCCDNADTLIQRASASSAQAHPGDLEKARSLLEESLSISVELGMPPLKERSEKRLDLLAASPAATPTYPAGLSQREVEVLLLIAAGKSNREIAG